MNQSLIRRYEVPFKIIVKASKISYRVDMLHHLKIHSIFHASQLKPYFKEVEDKDRGVVRESSNIHHSTSREQTDRVNY